MPVTPLGGGDDYYGYSGPDVDTTPWPNDVVGTLAPHLFSNMAGRAANQFLGPFGQQFGDLYSKYFGHMGGPAGLPPVGAEAFGGTTPSVMPTTPAAALPPGINLSHPGGGGLQIVGGTTAPAGGGIGGDWRYPVGPQPGPMDPSIIARQKAAAAAAAPVPASPASPASSAPTQPARPVTPTPASAYTPQFGGSSPAATATRPPAASAAVPGPLADPGLIQWQVPGSPGVSSGMNRTGGPSAPIYTAANFGNLFGGGGTPARATAQAPGASQAPATPVYPGGKSTTPGGPFMPVDITGYKVAGVNAPPTLDDLAAMIRFPAGKRPPSLMPYGASGAGY